MVATKVVFSMSARQDFLAVSSPSSLPPLPSEARSSSSAALAPGVGQAAVASWLEIDAAALAHNIEVFRRVGAREGEPRAVGAVLKGNAYGHGLLEVLPALHGLVDCIYVIAPGEALAVRRLEEQRGLPRRRVLVLGAVAPEEVSALASLDVEVVLGDGSFHAFAERLRADQAPPLSMHLHVDTGLGREGFHPEELPAVMASLGPLSDVLVLKGALSHFANVEDVTEQAYALEQVRRFEGAMEILEQAARGPLERHMAASAASLVLPSARLDALRVGIALYGLWPSSETRLSARVVLGDPPPLKPALSWRARSQVVRELPAGAYVGYGCTYRCEEPTRVAVLPVGYFDGYPRLLSGKAHVLVNGRRCPVLGRVMMNHLIVDVTRATDKDAPVIATLLGRDGDEKVSAEQLATWAETISYEIVARLGAHLRRVLV